jgi:hypothetical protein
MTEPTESSVPFGPGGPGYPPPAGPSRRRWLLIAVVAVVVIAAGTTGALLLLHRDPPAAAPAAVTLERVGAPTADPFLTSTTVQEVTEFPDEVREVVDADRSTATVDPSLGTFVLSGDRTDLYGGSQQQPTGPTSAPSAATTATSAPASGSSAPASGSSQVFGGSGSVGACDVEELAQFLEQNPEKDAAWSAVLGVPSGGVRSYLAMLTPVTLLSDTLVTNHAWRDGRAVPYPAVLQAGTAVLVDWRGLPVVRCACGNPLTAAPDVPASALRVDGTPWDGFALASTVRVRPGAEMREIHLVDVADGSRFTRAVGPVPLNGPTSTAPSSPTTTVTTSKATAPSTPAAPQPLFVGVVNSAVNTANFTSSIVTSPDGKTWAKRFDAGARIEAVAVNGTSLLAVGDAVWASRDGQTWAKVPGSPALSSVVWDGKRWVGVKADEYDSSVAATAVGFTLWTSADGQKWTSTSIKAASKRSRFLDSGVQIGMVDKAYEIVAGGFAGDGPIQSRFRSTDLATWTELAEPTLTGGKGNLLGVGVGNGRTYASLTDRANDLAADAEYFRAAAAWRTGANAWATTALAQQLLLRSLSCSGSKGWLAVGNPFEMAGPSHPVGTEAAALWNSRDLVHWTKIGGPAATLTEVVHFGAAAASPIVCAVPAAPAGADTTTAQTTAPAPTTAPTTGGGQQDVPVGQCVVPAGYQGKTYLAIPESAGHPTCAAMRAQWQRYLDWDGPKTGLAQIAQFGDGTSCLILPLGAQINGGWDGHLADCTLADGSMSLFPPSSWSPGAGPTAPATTPTTTAASDSGDLRLSQPIANRDCDKSMIVVLFSSITPGAYKAEIAQKLQQFPGSKYLRTDRSCRSLVQSVNGNPVYAVYRDSTTDGVCSDIARAAAEGASGPTGRRLDGSDPDDAKPSC